MAELFLTFLKLIKGTAVSGYNIIKALIVAILLNIVVDY